jgi:hypothetical protein
MPPVTPIFPKQNYPTPKMFCPPGKRYPCPSGTRPPNSVGIGYLRESETLSLNDGKQKEAERFDCLSIARHVENCPICSKLYDTDKTLYILAILGLLILCFLMVKRIVKL